MVTGKGNKQRPVYFDARTKLHLTAYLQSRNDSNPALFVALNGDGDRISIGGIESRLRRLGKDAGINRFIRINSDARWPHMPSIKACRSNRCKNCSVMRE